MTKLKTLASSMSQTLFSTENSFQHENCLSKIINILGILGEMSGISLPQSLKTLSMAWVSFPKELERYLCSSYLLGECSQEKKSWIEQEKKSNKHVFAPTHQLQSDPMR